MTPRERIESILNRWPTDRLAWTTLADEKTLSAMPERYRTMSSPDFCRAVGCDVLQFGNYGLPRECHAWPARLVRPAEETWTNENGTSVRRTATAWGTLTAAFRDGHPVKHPVGTVEELRILKRLWQNSRYEETADAADSCRRAADAVGEDGLYLHALGPSPVQQLIETDMGLARFYYFLEDHAADVEELLAAMHACRVQEYEITARRTCAAGIIAVENTSSTLTSPAVYGRYSVPQIRDYAEAVHRHGKKLVLHMCGRLKDLLGEVARTDLDAINGLTPPPVGDCGPELALDRLGEGLVILGHLFQPTVLHRPGVTRAEIERELDALYTPRIRRANFLLWIGVDGLPTPIERFVHVREWMDRNGTLR